MQELKKMRLPTYKIKEPISFEPMVPNIVESLKRKPVPFSRMAERRDIVNWRETEKFKEFNENPGPQHNYQPQKMHSMKVKQPGKQSSVFSSIVGNCQGYIPHGQSFANNTTSVDRLLHGPSEIQRQFRSSFDVVKKETNNAIYSRRNPDEIKLT
mmetsp:Transcript_8418/g.12818  ORF Transcript_8418/g.12818 Transcript_8418/m.12818 type:complete len:155 (-) Transcript_8418:1406-1870(-)